MPNITVNPTRMELTRLKGKLRHAQRGHKLLKDKRDELMKQFLDTVREVRALRQEVEEELMTVHGAFTVASALMSSQALEQALLDPKQSVKLTQTTKNIMSVNVPVYDFQTQTRSDADIYPYGFAATSGELDTAVDALGKVFRKMLKLAEVEKSAQLMAEEIEKTRRRVNALEYVVIPNTQDAIRYITMKLDENDRATTTRLMKVKDIVLRQPAPKGNGEARGGGGGGGGGFRNPKRGGGEGYHTSALFVCRVKKKEKKLSVGRTPPKTPWGGGGALDGGGRGGRGFPSPGRQL